MILFGFQKILFFVSLHFVPNLTDLKSQMMQKKIWIKFKLSFLFAVYRCNVYIYQREKEFLYVNNIYWKFHPIAKWLDKSHSLNSKYLIDHITRLYIYGEKNSIKKMKPFRKQISTRLFIYFLLIFFIIEI